MSLHNYVTKYDTIFTLSIFEPADRISLHSKLINSTSTLASIILMCVCVCLVLGNYFLFPLDIFVSTCASLFIYLVLHLKVTSQTSFPCYAIPDNLRLQQICAVQSKILVF